MKKITITTLLEKKKKREPITMLTAYDYTFAGLADEAGVDAILVGDSLGMAVLGYSTTIPVTMEEMIHHVKAVSRGTKQALLVADMPFLSYAVSQEEALRNAGRFFQEAGAEAVKLEGGRAVAATAKRLMEIGIPVMGHLGLTPQSVHQLGGYRIQGKSEESAKHLLEEALILEEAGCFSLVLECVSSKVAEEISKRLRIPVIGIGSGNQCDGQVMVIYDCLGLTSTDFRPKFVKRFGNFREEAGQAIRLYIEEVQTREFPSPEQSF